MKSMEVPQQPERSREKKNDNHEIRLEFSRGDMAYLLHFGDTHYMKLEGVNQELGEKIVVVANKVQEEVGQKTNEEVSAELKRRCQDPNIARVVGVMDPENIPKWLGKLDLIKILVLEYYKNYQAYHRNEKKYFSESE